MLSNKNNSNLPESKNKIPIVGLRSLNLYQKSSSKFNSPKKSIFRKNENRSQLLYYINSPKSTLNSKIKFSPGKFSLSNSLSQSKDAKLDSLSKTYVKKFKQKLFSKNLLLTKNINVYTPKIKNLQLFDKSAHFKPSDDYYIGKLMKNSFSNNKKATNASSVFNLNYNLDKTATYIKSKKIKFDQNEVKNKKEKEKSVEEYNLNIRSEKNIFEKKIKRKKLNEAFKNNILYINRKKYPFTKVTDYFQFHKYKDVPQSISKINKKMLSILLKENKSIFNHPINVIKKGQFSKKFENPRDIEIYNYKNESYDIKEIHLGEYILNNKLIKSEDKIKIKKEKKDILRKFKKKLIEINLIKKNLIIPISEIIKNYKLPNHIMNFKQTLHLNYFIKIQDINSALIVLRVYPHVVIDIDQFYMTPLHYAAKYNFYQIIPYLLGYGAYIDAKNSFGITPLMLCLKKNYFESMFILLLNLADPFVKIGYKYYIKENDIDFNTIDILKRIKTIHINNRFFTDKNFYESVRNAIYNYIINECQNFVSKEFINLININYKT